MELEDLLKRSEKDPDLLHNLFVKVSGDLAYASTFYPKRSVRAYLNQLTQQVFDSMEEKKSEWSLDAIKHFFRHILPIEMYKSRKALLTSFLIFSLAVLIGIVSSSNNPEFVRVILGDDYVEMTEKNINNNDPMAVYKGQDQSEMFFMITVNNVKVAFLCFILGLFGSLGTIIILLTNGIMVGAFQYYFYAKGFFVESFLTIWIHGTIEISAIIIAGMAGIVLGNGVLFPKTHSRSTSLQISSQRAVRIIAGIVPLFIIAGFLESFVTRLTDLPTIVKVSIIVLSLAYIIGMYILYPIWYVRQCTEEELADEIVPDKVASLVFKKDQLRSFAQNLSLGFSQFRTEFGVYFKHAFIPLSIGVFISILVYQYVINSNEATTFYDSYILNGFELGGLTMFIVYWLATTYAFMIIGMIYNEVALTSYNQLAYVKYYFVNMLLVTLLPIAICYFYSIEWVFLHFVAVPPQIIIRILNDIPKHNWKIWVRMGDYYKLAFSNWIIYISGFVVIVLMHFLLFLLVRTPLFDLFMDFIYWHNIFEDAYVGQIIVTSMAYFILFLVGLPMYYFLLADISFSESAKLNASDLWNRYESFHSDSSIFETAT